MSETKHPVQEMKVDKELNGMIAADRDLYEKILDSPMAFHFNNLCQLAQYAHYPSLLEQVSRYREALEKIRGWCNHDDDSDAIVIIHKIAKEALKPII